MYLSQNLEFLLHQEKMKKADLARLLEVSRTSKPRSTLTVRTNPGSRPW
jgi:hypothetical protein